MFYYQCLIITTKVPLLVNIIIKRLDIDGALSTLRHVMPLVEGIKDSTYFVSISIVFRLFYFQL